jgi:Ca-activated chloride channel family protein
MEFYDPITAWAFVILGWVLLPAAAGLLVHAYLARRKAAERFVDPVMRERLFPPGNWGLPLVKGGVLILGLTLLFLAAARPRFGEKQVREVGLHGADVVILLDVSKSMTAEDVGQARLGRAKSGIRDLLARFDGDRVGLVVFAGEAAVKAPLTTDRRFFLSVLDRIDTDSAPRGGSLIGDGIRKCLELFEPDSHRGQAIVLISDGDDQGSFPLRAAGDALERGVRILAVGLGDPVKGARIPVQDESGERRFVKHEGQEVWSKLNGELLENIALKTEGAYVPAETRAYDLGQVYDDVLADLSRSEYHSETRRQLLERFQWPLAAGILLLMIEMMIPAYPRLNQLPVAQEWTA